MDLTDNIKSLQRKYLTSCKSLSDQNFDSGEEACFNTHWMTRWSTGQDVSLITPWNASQKGGGCPGGEAVGKGGEGMDREGGGEKEGLWMGRREVM